MRKISVSRDFSNVPAGRYYSDGPNSGQRFRVEKLVPALRQGSVEITLDAEGYGSSFLEESFGGLVREEGFDEFELRERLNFVSDDSTLVDEIWLYVASAQRNKSQ